MSSRRSAAGRKGIFMKRFLTILLTTLALAGVLCVSASASSFDSAAKELSAIGMFKGNASGFDLDSAPTRGQAAIMLVRLYGAEAEAQRAYSSGRITCPFTDVNETVAPYVAWLADEGLAAGITESTFGASEPCTAKAYTIFLLRALGYQDKVDFTTAGAEEFAMGIGLLDTSVFSGKFLRDDLAAMTYQALGTDLKDGSTYLLDHLIEEGGISASAALPIVEKIEVCRALNSASESLNKGLSASLDTSMTVTVSNTPAGGTQPSGQIETMAVSVKGDITAVMPKMSLPQMALDLTVKTDSESETVKMWMRDGWLYAQSGETATKTDMRDDFETLGSLLTADSKASGGAILPFLENAGKKTSGGQTAYTLEMNSAFEDMINSLMARILKEAGIPENTVGKINLHNITFVYNVMNSGSLKSVTGDMIMSMDLPVGGGTVTIGMAMEMEMAIKASGSAVKISFPDFSGFEEVIGGAEASAIGVIGGADGPTAIITTIV